MFRWVGLGLAIAGGIGAVIAGGGGHWEAAIICGIIFIIGMFVLSRPNV